MIQKITLFLLLLMMPTEANMKVNDASDLTILQINTKWNQRNDVDIPSIRGCVVQYAFLEDQSPSFRQKIDYVPVIVLYKGNKPVHQWSADLSFKLKITKEEIHEVVDRFR